MEILTIRDGVVVQGGTLDLDNGGLVRVKDLEERGNRITIL